MTPSHRDPEFERLQLVLSRRARRGREDAFERELRERLLDRAAQLQAQRDGQGRFSARQRARLRRRVLVAGATAAIVVVAVLAGLGVLAASNRLATASAATILREAAARAVAAGQAAEFTYALSITEPSAGIDSTGHVEVWYEPRAGGSGISLQTLTLAKRVGQPERLFGRYLQIGGDLYSYDANRGSILLPASRQDVSALVLPNIMFDGRDLARALAPVEGGTRVRSLPQQRLDGRVVDVVEVDSLPDRPALRVLLYYDIASHVLRGFRAYSTDPSYPTVSWLATLTASKTTSARLLPAFKLGAPAHTPVLPPRPTKHELFSACGPGIRGVAASSILEACLMANPSLTRQAALHRLTAAAIAQLNAAIRAGAITNDQAALALAATKTQFERILAGKPDRRK